MEQTSQRTDKQPIQIDVRYTEEERRLLVMRNDIVIQEWSRQQDVIDNKATALLGVLAVIVASIAIILVGLQSPENSLVLNGIQTTENRDRFVPLAYLSVILATTGMIFSTILLITATDTLHFNILIEKEYKGIKRKQRVDRDGSNDLQLDAKLIRKVRSIMADKTYDRRTRTINAQRLIVATICALSAALFFTLLLID